MKDAKVLLDEVCHSTRRTLDMYVREFEHLEEETLVQRPAENSWSILECLSHLNLAHQNYVKQMDLVLKQKDNDPPLTKHVTGWIARKAIQMMRPVEKRQIRWKMKTMPSMQPVTSGLQIIAIQEEFLRQQQRILSIAEEARTINIARPRIKTALGPLKFNFGDALAFIAAHTERHMVQMLQVKRALSDHRSTG